ncbi:unnamed protein product [Sympodiomycopsis kandeliae]
MPPVGLEVARSGHSPHRSPVQSRTASSSPTRINNSSPIGKTQYKQPQPKESSSHHKSLQAPTEKSFGSYADSSKSTNTANIVKTSKMSTPKSHQKRQNLPRSRPSKFSGRRKEDIRPERKASVRKQDFSLDDDGSLGDEDGNEQDESDLSDLSDPEDDTFTFDPSSSRANDPANNATGSIANSDDSDDDMAAKLMEAGDGDSLLGSGESDVGQEDGEEQYIIADAKKAEARARARDEKARILENRQREKAEKRKRQRLAEDGAQGDIEDETVPEDDLGAFSPETARLLGLPVIDSELYQEQQGFHSDSEPSFSDFFASDHAEEGADDDDELTSFDEDDDDSDISDLETALIGEPFLAHVGALGGVVGTESVQDGVAVQASIGDETVNAQNSGAMMLQQDIPLLVIEDLDGRLIYARAGDGEAVFGSDGEFEFVDSEDEDDTDDELEGLDARDPRWATRAWPAGSGPTQPDEDVFEDDGDTTDELPDEEMPFPRLLVGSVGPRGGRTSRRARAMAAQMRKLSPSGRKRGHERSNSNITDATMSVTSPTTPNTDLDLPLVGDVDTSTLGRPELDSSNPGQPPATSSSGEPSTNALALNLPSVHSPAGTQREAEASGMPTTPTPGEKASNLPTFAQVLAGDDDRAKPAMGSFMPSSSKSIHRAVVDGSHKAASPFTSKHSLQRRGLAGRRRPRQSSFSSHGTMKRPRRDDGSHLFAGQEEMFSEPSSSPETLKTSAPLPMELDDVVDASMLWRSGDSSDGETADNNDSDLSDSTAAPSQRSQSKTSDANGPSDGFGLNANAFSRWRKIPMGAFREQQQGMLSGGGGTPRNAGNRNGLVRHGSAQQAFAGNYLLQRVGHEAQRRQDHSPFRRNGNHGSSLHMVVPAAHSPLMPGHNQIIVSPVLWPVNKRSRGNDDMYDDDGSMRPPFVVRQSGGNELSNGHPEGGSARKMTKREKRERKARRAMLRKAARAEREQVRSELTRSNTGDDGDGGAGSTFNTAPSTPNIGTASAIPDYLSPSKGMGMPRLQITEASPRASPNPGFSHGQSTNGNDAHQLQSDNHSSQDHHMPPPSTLPGNTPPTHAVADNSNVPSLPSATFGPPLASPLFGGMFAPLNMSSADEHDLDREGEGVLQI